MLPGHPLFDRLWSVLAVLGLGGEGERTVATEEALSRAARTAVGDAAIEAVAAQAALEAARAAGATPREGPEAPALAALPVRDREALALRDAGEFPPPTVADLCGVEEAALPAILGRARRAVLEGLGRAGRCDRTAASLGPGLEGAEEEARSHATRCEICAAALEAWAEVAASWRARRPPVSTAAEAPRRRRILPVEAGLAALSFLVILAVAAFHQGWEAGAVGPPPSPVAGPVAADDAASGASEAYAPAAPPYEPSAEGTEGAAEDPPSEAEAIAPAPPVAALPPTPAAPPTPPAGAVERPAPATPPSSPASPPSVRPAPSSVSLPAFILPAVRPIGDAARPTPPGALPPPPGPPEVASPSWPVASPPAHASVRPPAEAPPPQTEPVESVRLVVRFRLPRDRIADLRALAASIGGALHIEDPIGGPDALPARAFFAFPVDRADRVDHALSDLGVEEMVREDRPAPSRPVHVVRVEISG